jgi:hypothetical protein
MADADDLSSSLDAGDHFATAFHLAALRKLGPPCQSLRRTRGDQYARPGEWAASTADYARAVNFQPTFPGK